MARLFQAIEGKAEKMLAEAKHTRPHSGRVAALAQAMTEEALKQGVDVWALGALSRRHGWAARGLKRQAPEVARVEGKTHDVGKPLISRKYGHRLWTKKGLTPREWEVIKTHPVEAYWFLHALGGRGAELIAELGLHHHERFDGKGYPSGLKGSQIPMLNRLHFVADTLDAIRFPRPYKFGTRKISFNGAVGEIRSNSGTQFDPAAVRVFMKMVRSRHPALDVFK